MSRAVCDTAHNSNLHPTGQMQRTVREGQGNNANGSDKKPEQDNFGNALHSDLPVVHIVNFVFTC